MEEIPTINEDYLIICKKTGKKYLGKTKNNPSSNGLYFHEINYYCDKCEYKVKKRSSFEDHLKTKKHLKNPIHAYLNEPILRDDIGNYTCIKCNFQTKNKKDFTRHIKTNKHNKNPNL